MENTNADNNNMAITLPTRKKRGRKPTVFLDNKPIDPKYYVNYYHNVTKQKGHSCPYCKKTFACKQNLDWHLNKSKKDCVVEHFMNQYPDSNDSDEWSKICHAGSPLDIKDSSPINRWLDTYIDKPAPRTQQEWIEASQVMLKMMIDSYDSKHGK